MTQSFLPILYLLIYVTAVTIKTWLKLCNAMQLSRIMISFAFSDYFKRVCVLGAGTTSEKCFKKLFPFQSMMKITCDSTVLDNSCSANATICYGPSNVCKDVERSCWADYLFAAAVAKMWNTSRSWCRSTIKVAKGNNTAVLVYTHVHFSLFMNFGFENCDISPKWTPNSRNTGVTWFSWERYKLGYRIPVFDCFIILQWKYMRRVRNLISSNHNCRHNMFKLKALNYGCKLFY